LGKKTELLNHEIHESHETFTKIRSIGRGISSSAKCEIGQAEAVSMQKTFNAKTQRCEGAKVLETFTGSLGCHRLAGASCRAAAVRISLGQLCGLASLRLRVGQEESGGEHARTPNASRGSRMPGSRASVLLAIYRSWTARVFSTALGDEDFNAKTPRRRENGRSSLGVESRPNSYG
jgi:hypothetical protein